MKVPRKSAEDLEGGARIRAHIRQAMHERGIDQAEVARRIGVKESTVSRILSAGRIPQVGIIIRISRGLKINYTKLLDEDASTEFWDENQTSNT
jgi:transcriptional regulator with XRE-family HTH domain